jgi:hypothetical protein
MGPSAISLIVRVVGLRRILESAYRGRPKPRGKVQLAALDPGKAPCRCFRGAGQNSKGILVPDSLVSDAFKAFKGAGWRSCLSCAAQVVSQFQPSALVDAQLEPPLQAYGIGSTHHPNS